MNRAYVWGGMVASVILVAFGVASFIVGLRGIDEVRDTLREENIVGPDDSTIPGERVDTGSEARAQADIMREHQLETTQGLTYAEMGRFATADGNPKGTNNADEALKDANGRPVSNTARSSWINFTALSTSLQTAAFAEQVGLFAVVMGIALLLTGIGFGILTWQVLRNTNAMAAQERTRAAATTTGTGPTT